VKTLSQLQRVKTMPNKFNLKGTFMIFALVVMTAIMTFAQGTGFNFQGRLNDGTTTANGRYDLQFRLYDAIAGGNQIGVVAGRPNTTLVNGVFSVTLDFGSTAFNNPNSIFIEIGVRPNASPNAYTILGPRQQLTVVPFAVRAANATNADTAALATNAQNAVNANNAATATNALNLGGVEAGNYLRLVTPNVGDLNISGNVVLTGGGNLTIRGHAQQSATSSGLVKAMLYVQQDGTILRCYNGITNNSTATCGFTVGHTMSTGFYDVIFNFRVDDRFFALSARNPAVLATFVGANFSLDPGNPNTMYVKTFITNAGADFGNEANFMLIVY
jgi:hypothetical protein